MLFGCSWYIKKCVEICVRLFKMRKYVLELAHQIGPKYSSYLPFPFPLSFKSPIQQQKTEPRHEVRETTLTVCFTTS